jgi:radical SAM protein with 4Fe4S-binding SPASM domain
MGKKTYAAALGEGETRDCIDPWSFILVEAAGAVKPCCWHAPVGSIEQAPLQEILASEASQTLRARLLTGQLDEECLRCPARGVIAKDALLERVQAYLASIDARTGLQLNECTDYEMINVPGEDWYSVDNDGIFLHPNHGDSPPATIRFPTLTVTAQSELVARVKVGSKHAYDVTFSVAVVQGAVVTPVADVRVSRGSALEWSVPLGEYAGDEVTLQLTTAMCDGEQANYAWAYFFNPRIVETGPS